MKTLYYAIVNKKGNLAVMSGQLPIYWNEEVAKRVCRDSLMPGHKIIPIKISDIYEHLLHQSKE